MSLVPVTDGVLAGTNVLVVSHGFQVAYERGFCSALAANGARVTLAASDNSDTAGMHPGVRIENIRGSQRPERARMAKAFNLLRYHFALVELAWRERHACLHVIGLMDAPVLTGIFQGVLFRMMCRRYLFTVHNLLPHDRHSASNRRLYRLIYRLPSCLVVHTASMREQLVAEFDVDRARVVVMAHGCELGPDFVLPTRQRDPATLKLLFFGTVAHYKGLDLLLDALARLPKHHELRIVGRCRSAALRESLERSVALLVAQGRQVTWRNEYVPEAEMADAFLWADMLVMPYRHIDQSGVVFQALKFGVPVVATRVGEFGSMITHEIGELCEPESADALEQAVLRLASRIDSMTREFIAASARQYDWRTTVQSLSRSYTGGT